MFSFLNDVFNYEDRKVGRDEVEGFVISTAYTSDEGYETAIGDAAGFHPVERYSSKEEAVTGHAKWLQNIAGGMTKITMLGWLDGVVDDEEIELVKR